MVATGGTITTSGDYKIHTFTGSSSFVVVDAGTDGTYGGKADYLIFSGGGGGGSFASINAGTAGAGGGGGGYLTGTSTSLSAGSMTVTVGGGGNSGFLTPDGGSGYKGSDSSWNSLAPTGGGGGAGSGGSSAAKRNGGSGGGASAASWTTVGSAVSGQGHAGGRGYNDLHRQPGGVVVPVLLEEPQIQTVIVLPRKLATVEAE